MEKFNKLKNNRGIAAFIALMVMIMLTLIGIAAIKLANDEINIAGNELNEMAAFYAAEAGLERASAAIQDQYDSTGAPPAVLPSGNEALSNCVVAYNTVDNGAAVQRQLTMGDFAGLNAMVKTFTITSTGVSQSDSSQILLTQEFECALVPIFQFAVFYEEFLQTSPTFGMTIDGRVHVNSDMWLNGWNGITFTDKVTCAGSIYHGLENGAESGAPADVFFTDDNGVVSNWKNGSVWLDANHANWYDSASARWGGMVRDQAFGQKKLNMPLTNIGDPHKIIERAAGNPDSYENKADLKILDGVPYVKIGAIWTDISTFIPAGTVTDGGAVNFYDAHEKKTVTNTEIDMALLKTCGYFPPNGVVYISDQRAVSATTMNGTKLVNGTDIGNALTIVCENPVYVEGDYNTINKQPASVIADACTYLSNQWDGINELKDIKKYSFRPVTSKTEVNLSFIGGDLVPTATNYGGGLENLPRFLEHWNGQEFKLRGSMICLWKSQQANGTYEYMGNPGYYSAPTRNWGFDHDLDDPIKLPPESPQVRVFQRIGWTQQNVGYAQGN
jgi:Tfp pilus assembly protein PilX